MCNVISYYFRPCAFMPQKLTLPPWNLKLFHRTLHSFRLCNVRMFIFIIRYCGFSIETVTYIELRLQIELSNPKKKKLFIAVWNSHPNAHPVYNVHESNMMMFFLYQKFQLNAVHLVNGDGGSSCAGCRCCFSAVQPMLKCIPLLLCYLTLAFNPLLFICANVAVDRIYFRLSPPPLPPFFP